MSSCDLQNSENVSDTKDWDEFEKSHEELRESILNSWPKNEQEGFKKSCIQNAISAGSDRKKAEEYCDCSLYKMMEAYPNIEDVSKVSIDEMSSLVEDCR